MRKGQYKRCGNCARSLQIDGPKLCGSCTADVRDSVLHLKVAPISRIKKRIK